MARVIASVIAAVAVMIAAPVASARVLLVGTYKGHRGTDRSVQAAVKRARPGDWILVAPGDYKGRVWIYTDRLHLRGMNRNSTVIDGTRRGASRCSSRAADQTRGAQGRNGLMVLKASGDVLENLTVCNFSGNEIWFNGGDGSGKIGMGAWSGSYLTATTTFYGPKVLPTAYALFTSNARGPGRFEHDYGSNMDDSAFYVGACEDCHAVLNHVQGEHSSLGYSGTNSGGHVLIENSEFDDNLSGIVTNSQNNEDAPSPQDGACPAGQKGPTGTASCELYTHNNIHDNNDPNVPRFGVAGLSALGSGVIIAGGRNDTIADNRITHNGAWGVLLVPYPDSGPPPKIANCRGGVFTAPSCFFDDWGNEVAANTFSGNGFFANPTNGDLADISGANPQGNCWHGNVELGGGTVTAEPIDLQTTHATCGQPNQGDSLVSPLAVQAICDTQLAGPCPNTPGMSYPRATKITIKPIPHKPGMPNPCRGVPANPWCPKR